MNVVVFLIWFIILAACAGTVLFRGQLRSRCYDLGATAIAAAGGDAKSAVCPGKEELLATYAPVMDVSGESIVCGLDYQNCPSGATCCFNGEHPGGGYYRFDNAVWSSFLVLQGLTVDGWNEVCYVLMDALGWPVLLWYSLVVFCGAFFVMQLLSAVIVTSLKTCSAEATLADQLEMEREKRRERNAAQGRENNPEDGVAASGADAAALGAMASAWESPAMEPVRRAVRLHMPMLYDLAESEGFNNFILGCIAVNTVNMMSRHYPESDDFEFAQEIINYIFTAAGMSTSTVHSLTPHSRPYTRRLHTHRLSQASRHQLYSEPRTFT